MFEKPFPIFLDEERRNAKLTQTELCGRTGLCRKHYSHLESGTRQPSARDLQAFQDVYGKVKGYVAPDGHARRLAENNRTLRPECEIFHPPQDRPSYLRYYAALKAYPEFVHRMMRVVRARTDFGDCQYHCGRLAMDSSEEVPFVLRLLAAGALPGYCSPLLLGHTPHPLVNPETREQVGHFKLPYLAFPNDFYYFQPTFATPKLYRVDILRWNYGFSVIEIDGSGHRTAYDEERIQAIGLKTRRLTPQHIMADNFLLRDAA